MRKSKKPMVQKSRPAKAKGVSATEVGRHLDMSRQRVGQLQAEGVFPRLDDGRFDLNICRIAYIRWMKDENRRGTKASGASRVSESRARAIEQRIAREDGRLIETDDVFAAVADILGTFRSELAGVPAATTRDLGVRSEIEKHLEGAIGRCRLRFKAIEEGVRAGHGVQLGE
jgi:hypothetical protein